MEGAGEGRVGAGATAGAWQAAIAGQGGGLQPPPWVQGRAQPAPHRPTTTANGSTRSMTHAQATQPLEFYDIWVARDADGRRFTKAPPHASDPYSVPRATAGLPFPVSCCWNGLVALPAAPFRDAGLRVAVPRRRPAALAPIPAFVPFRHRTQGGGHPKGAQGGGCVVASKVGVRPVRWPHHAADRRVWAARRLAGERVD